jgi:zinc transport system permease protein
LLFFILHSKFKKMNILSYTFFQNALIGSLLASIVCGIVGTYIVTRRLVFISGGITHSSFGGIGIGVFAGLNPIISAMVFAVMCACGIQWMSHKGNVREDSAIALFWTFGMSIGIICCFLTPGFMPDMPSYLFGSILAVGKQDIILLLIVTFIVAAFFLMFYHSIISIAFDPVFAKSQHLHVQLIEYVMMALIAMTIVSTLRLVGIVLAISLLTVPQMTANLMTFSFKKIIFLSIMLGWIDCIIGLGVGYWLNVPSGASIIFVSILVYAIVRLAVSIRNKQLQRVAD